MRRSLAVVVLATVATSGCAWRSDVDRLRADLKQLSDSVNLLAAPPPAASAASVENVNTRLVAVGTQVGAAEARLHETTAQLARLEARVAGAERAVQDVAARVDGLGTTVAKLEASAARPPAPAAAPVAIAPREAPGKAAAAGPQRLYAAALSMFRAREHGQAVLDFLDFLARHPRHALAPSAQFWIGEAYFVQRDYRQALFEFEKVLAYGPKTPKVADALLRAGMAAKQLREADRADQYWRRVVEEYPNSDAAQKARGFMSGIGGSSSSR